MNTRSNRLERKYLHSISIDLELCLITRTYNSIFLKVLENQASEKINFACGGYLYTKILNFFDKIRIPVIWH